MKRDLSKLLMPDHPLYTEAVEALKLYHQAQAEGAIGAELERLRLLAEQPFPGCHRLPAPSSWRLGRERPLATCLNVGRQHESSMQNMGRRS